MPRPKTDGPTERELEILDILWDKGPSTTRDIHTELSKKQKVAYNSVLTIMTIMLDKGLVSRDDSQKSHIYTANHNQEQIQNEMLNGFMNRVFGGSAMNLVSRALSIKNTSKEDKDQIKELLKEMESDAKPD